MKRILKFGLKSNNELFLTEVKKLTSAKARTDPELCQLVVDFGT